MYQWTAEAYFAVQSTPEQDPNTAQQPAPCFTAFDLETTGLYPEKDAIVEIGAIKFDKRGPVGRYSVLVDPGFPMPKEAGRINGISDAMLKGKPGLDEVLPDFLNFIQDTILIAHNASFDVSFINAALKKRWANSDPADIAQQSLLDDIDTEAAAETKPVCRVPWPALPNKVADTLVLAKELYPGRPNYKMQNLASSMGITALEAHRAEDDARVCMELFVLFMNEAVRRIS